LIPECGLRCRVIEIGAADSDVERGGSQTINGQTLSRDSCAIEIVATG
jgi:hypothetical protein